MVKLQEFLEARGIDPKWFLEKAGSDEAKSWRARRLSGDTTPRYYINSAFQWGSVSSPINNTRWWDLEDAWICIGDHARWRELEKVLGWLDPLETELMDVKDG